LSTARLVAAKKAEGREQMITLTKKLSAATLVLALLLAVGSTANAQSRFGGRMSGKEKAAYIGGGAAAGALLGGLLGGKKGAVIGGLLGAGGGAGVVYYKGKQDEDRYGRYYGDRRYRDYRGYTYRGYSDRRVYDSRNFGYSRDRSHYSSGFRR
jgi:hypothetical protein